MTDIETCLLECVKAYLPEAREKVNQANKKEKSDARYFIHMTYHDEVGHYAITYDRKLQKFTRVDYQVWIGGEEVTREMKINL